MSKVTIFVGIDYHQDVVQVCVMDRQGQVLANQSVSNSVEGLAAVVAPHGSEVHAAIEACGGAAAMADALVTRLGWVVDMAHPGYVARIKQSPDKTDFSDARLLADLVRVGYLPRVWLAPFVIRELRRVVRYRQQLVAQVRSNKLRIRGLLRENRAKLDGITPWTKKWILWLHTTEDVSPESHWVIEQLLRQIKQLQDDIVTVEERLSHLTADDPVVAGLLDQKGVGLITAVTLRAEIGRFDRFRSGKQLSRFCGLSPRNASSGNRQADAGLIKAGNPQLRTVLIELAHRLKRWDRRWAKLAFTMQMRDKKGSVIAAAVANRWVRWLFHQMQSINQTV
jgi:transposase